MENLSYLYGKPLSEADLRTSNEDFQVQEIIPFVPSGEGEHHLLHIRKNGLNTTFVAEKLAKFAGVHPRDVTYAGQKDRYAITDQWFGIRIPGKDTPEWIKLTDDSLQVLSSHRHSKKLRIGALTGNYFKLVLRNVTDPEDAIKRIEKIKRLGVPNYFGEQRFGRQGKNLEFGRQMFAGKKVRDKNKRSMYLSSIRSFLFNEATSYRLLNHGLEPLNGDCVQLAGSKSFFTVDEWDETLLARLSEKDIQLSAPMWGRGTLPAKANAEDMERNALLNYVNDSEGLENAGLNQERRAMILHPEKMKYTLDLATLTIEFILPAGSFATSVLREIVDYTDIRQAPQNSAK
ncbi:tRNA pseudouridine(13) synthase TruD [Parashewanella spongiae]|uniref:tRNA pseudouridine synthase D n=1 Tax=Parashewanella spongiae TaxID=342950 RepID=A0A3A6UGK1_9GAMM|nr:tRNA pseudouridine(13) synthase TruD [Parashewanella spongiae]MCL1077796.1 tRNA pseudouridine(13) synthase TruD [Parashewanella spongiae]RJY18040.1 tRNA pseudouridine(13) synthase TruD [Parashewanella spongiae]